MRGSGVRAEAENKHPVKQELPLFYCRHCEKQLVVRAILYLMIDEVLVLLSMTNTF